MNTCVSRNGYYLYIQTGVDLLEVFERGDQSSWEKVQNYEDEQGDLKQFQNPIQFPFAITSLEAHSLDDNLIFVGGSAGNLTLYDVSTNTKVAIETLANQDIKILRHYSRYINDSQQITLVVCDSIGKLRIFNEINQEDQIHFDLSYSENMNAEIKDIAQRNVQRDNIQYIDILILTEEHIYYQITTQKAILFYQWSQENQENQQTIDTLYYYKDQDYLAAQHQDELILFNFIEDKRNILNKQKVEFSEKSGIKYTEIQNQPSAIYFTPDCHTVKILNLKDQTVKSLEIDDELFGLQIMKNEIIVCSFKKLIWIYMKDQQLQEDDQNNQKDIKQSSNSNYQEIYNNYNTVGGTLSYLSYQVEVSNYNLRLLQQNIGLIYSDNFIKTIQFYQSEGQLTNSAQMVMLSQVSTNKSLQEQFFLENELTPGITNNISVVQTGESEFQVTYNTIKFNGQPQKQNVQIVQVPHKIDKLSIQAKSKSYSVLAYSNNTFSLYEVSINTNPQLASTFALDDDIDVLTAQLQGNYIIATTDKEILKVTQKGKTFTKCSLDSTLGQNIEFDQIEIVNQYILMIDSTNNRNFEKCTEIADCDQMLNKANNDYFKSLSACKGFQDINIQDFKATYTLDNTICCSLTFIGTNTTTLRREYLPYVLVFELQQEDILILKESRLFHFNNTRQEYKLQVQLDILSNMVVQQEQFIFVLQGLFSPYTIANTTTFIKNKNELITGIQGDILVNYSIDSQKSFVKTQNVFNCSETSLQKQIIYSTFTKYVTNKQITQALQLLQNTDPSVYDTIASLCIKMNQTSLLSNCVSKLQNLQLNQLIRADPNTNVSEIISNTKTDYIVFSSGRSLKNSGIKRKQVVKAIGERCYLLGDLQGYKLCQDEINYKINQQEETIDDLIDNFQEILDQQTEQQVIDQATQLNTKKGYYAAAKCLEINGNYVQASRFYELSNSDDSAVRAAISSQDNSLLYQIASKSTNKSAIRTAARYFINLGDSDSINKSLLLYTSAGCHLQAIDLCMQQKLYQNLCDVIRQAIENNAEISNAKLTDIASYLIGADVSQLPLDIQRYIQQTSIYLYSYAGDITTALSQINKFDVKITDQIANELQPTSLDSEENRKITQTIAALCYKSGLYQLACKKYLSVNDLQHSLQCLCKLNDPDKVIKFTIRSRNRACLIAAANWLANQNSQQYAPQITVFYQKAKAWEELSSWYLQRAYDMCTNDDGNEKQYQKALEQLEVCQNQLNGVNVGNERSEQFALIQKKINLNRKLLSGFLQIQEFAKNNITTEASEIVEMNTKKLISIINDSDVEVMVEVTDVLNWMVQFYQSRGEIQKAKDLQAKIQNLSNTQQQPVQNDLQIDLANQQQTYQQQTYQQNIQQQNYQQEQLQQQQIQQEQPQQQPIQQQQEIQQQPQQNEQQQQVIEGFPTSQSMVQQANQVTVALNNDEDLNIEL